MASERDDNRVRKAPPPPHTHTQNDYQLGQKAKLNMLPTPSLCYAAKRGETGLCWVNSMVSQQVDEEDCLHRRNYWREKNPSLYVVCSFGNSTFVVCLHCSVVLKYIAGLLQSNPFISGHEDSETRRLPLFSCVQPKIK